MSLAFLSFLCLVTAEYMGLAYMIPALKAVKAPLMLAVILFVYVIAKNRSKLYSVFRSPPFMILAIFLSWAGISILYALVSVRALDAFTLQAGYLMFFVVAFFLLKDQDKLRRFMFLCLAIHFALVLLNLEKLSQDDRKGSLMAGYFLGDGNDFGWSLAIFFPFTVYLLRAYKSFFLRCLTALFGMTAFIGVILTASRGASLAIFASIFYILTQLKKKAGAVVVLAVVVALTLAVATPAYIDRMQSIKSYEEDSSAKGRIVAWKAAAQMAIDYPFGIGAGNYPSVYGRFYRDRYADPSVYASLRWMKPHSIYFLTLAEYGLIGLILLLWLIYGLFRQNKVSTGTHRDPSRGQPWLSLSLKASLVAFSVGGFFLGGFNYPHIYLLAAMTLSTQEIRRREEDAGSV